MSNRLFIASLYRRMGALEMRRGFHDVETIRAKVPYKRFRREFDKEFIAYLKRGRGHFEVIPNAVLISIWVFVAVSTAWYAARKLEVWINRDKRYPWDWQRCRSYYWKLPIVRYDPTGLVHTKLPDEYAKLQDEMIDAAVARGTRKPD